MTSMHRNPVWLAIALGMVLAFGECCSISGQTLNCRYEYAAARKESLEKNKPLLLEFTTENCLWCKRLESTTLRDAKLVNWLNDRTVFLRLDADREPQIAQALRIGSYPTMILAAPNGTILSVIEGYLEAPKLQDHLERFVSTLPSANSEALARDYL